MITPITKEEFIKTINAIQKQMRFDENASKKLSKIFDTNSAFYNNYTIITATVELLQYLLNDEDDTIGYYIFELDFGSKEQNLKKSFKDKNIPLKTPQDLWNYFQNYG